MPPELSIVVPTYGRPEQARRAIRGLLECTEPEGGREIILVDDGSPEPLDDLFDPLPECVRVIRQENAGPAAARNAGLSAARGSIVAFTDDDTVVDPGWMIGLASALRSDPALGGVGGRIQPLVPGLIAGFVQSERFVDHGVDADGTVRYLVTANCAYRRSVLVDLDGFDTRFSLPSGEDVELSFRARALGWGLGLTDAAVVSHDHRTSIKGLLATAYRHGRSRRLLVAMHPDQVPRVMPASPLDHLMVRFRRYRSDGNGRFVSSLYLGAHLITSAVMALGALTGRASL